MKANYISLVDCTLREGNQAPGVKFSVEDSVAIAKRLKDIGIDCIEIGHPYASRNEFNRVKEVCLALPGVDVLAHARARVEDIESVARTGAAWVGIFAGVNYHSQKYRLQKTKHEILELIKRSIFFAKSVGLRVRYTVEDASRTAYSDLLEAYSIAIEAGADRICFADSVGNHEPSSVSEMIAKLKRDLPCLDLEVHLHDDRGLAMANALAAIAAGVSHISCSVNGLGERSGITDTCTLIANLHHSEIPSGAKLDGLHVLSEFVSAAVNEWPDARRPVIGKNSFTHTSKLHVTASSRSADSYHWMDPHRIGRNQTLMPISQKPLED